MRTPPQIPSAPDERSRRQAHFLLELIHSERAGMPRGYRLRIETPPERPAPAETASPFARPPSRKSSLWVHREVQGFALP